MKLITELREGDQGVATARLGEPSYVSLVPLILPNTSSGSLPCGDHIAKVCSVLVCFVSVSCPTTTAATLHIPYGSSPGTTYPTHGRVRAKLTDMQKIFEGIVRMLL